MAAQTVASEGFIDITITTFSSPEPDVQRGRKRRRSPPETLAARLPSTESATFRGRCRHRSSSRLDSSRNPSRLRGGSLSPTRRKLIRVVQLNRHRSQSPSRSRSPNTQESTKRRRQRTQSRSRNHETESKTASDPIVTSFLRHEIVIRSDSPSQKSKQKG
ncbi:hypothetical protein F5Y04DRAFT_7845 [Hypomontagnella monticulosa]|nr:hypothetical protein F5Y04DRAFT_7845 [Hypomontagnella monticulosa]